MRPIAVMINGLPGKMASETARALLEQIDEFRLVPLSFTGPEITDRTWSYGNTEVTLVLPENRESARPQIERHRPFIAVDYSLPNAVMSNCEDYCRSGWPFVVGTTGADYTEMKSRVAATSICAVANPNMSIPIVLIQSALAFLADNFPSALAGWTAGITESHQQGKVDTSGTAKHLVGYFNRLGVQIELDQIEKIREPERQRREVGIPEEHLGGHAYHTYRLHSPDGTVELGIVHNVLGRRTYALGTLKSVKFLQEQLDSGARGQLFSMLDVLRQGQQRRAAP